MGAEPAGVVLSGVDAGLVALVGLDLVDVAQMGLALFFQQRCVAQKDAPAIPWETRCGLGLGFWK